MAALYSFAFCIIAAVAVAQVNGAESGTGKTTRYWDCCKPSCSWTPNVSNMLKGPVQTCSRTGAVVKDTNAKSGCEGGDAYMCTKQQPRAINSTLAYGFVAAKVSGKSLQEICCSCYKLTFPKSAQLKNKQMIVQITNTGSDLEDGHFDIQMPGGGVGIFNGCTTQFKTDESKWGDRYGGIHQRKECDNLPKELQSGCHFRFDWFANADNPEMNYARVKCPAAIVSQTGCQRSDDPKN